MIDYTDASCRKADGDLFYPLGREGSEGYARGLAEARAVCATCPLLVPCLSYALASGDDSAVLAGTSPGERRALRVELGRVHVRPKAAPEKTPGRPRKAA